MACDEWNFVVTEIIMLNCTVHIKNVIICFWKINNPQKDESLGENIWKELQSNVYFKVCPVLRGRGSK